MINVRGCEGFPLQANDAIWRLLSVVSVWRVPIAALFAAVWGAALFRWKLYADWLVCQCPFIVITAIR